MSKASEVLRHFLGDQPEVVAHSHRVAAWCRDEFTRDLGLLHDVLEDSACDEETLESLVGRDLAEAASVLSRREGETYAQFVQRVADSGNGAAVHVKVADLFDHLDQSATLKPSLRRRYDRALPVLLAAHKGPLPCKFS